MPIAPALKHKPSFSNPSDLGSVCVLRRYRPLRGENSVILDRTPMQMEMYPAWKIILWPTLEWCKSCQILWLRRSRCLIQLREDACAFALQLVISHFSHIPHWPYQYIIPTIFAALGKFLLLGIFLFQSQDGLLYSCRELTPTSLVLTQATREIEAY